jgi:hypothetical protein
MARRSVPKDKKTKIPKKYLAKLLKSMSKLYKAGATIPLSMFKARVK